MPAKLRSRCPMTGEPFLPLPSIGLAVFQNNTTGASIVSYGNNSIDGNTTNGSPTSVASLM